MQILIKLKVTTIAVAISLLAAFSICNAADEHAETTHPSGDFSFFESKIRPVLVEHCYKCHSVESGKSKGGLLLDTREATRAGGDSGPAVVPGSPDKSLLLAAIAHSDDDLKMPPKKPRLPDSVIKDVETWIRKGAHDPREPTGKTLEKPPVDIESGRAFWAFIKPVAHKPPTTRHPDWSRRKLDRFVLAELEANGLSPRADADPVTLLRRVHFDIVGLPPTPDRVAAFVSAVKSDGLDAALEREVDTLLASPRYGERWGRHWLDVARFAESSGKETNVTFPHAWRYRDYVIDAFNADLPYDRFVTEQIAGDLLPADSDAERARLMIATGFLAVGPKGLNEMNVFQSLADIADEQIDTVGRAFMASTVACARCHDHKFDPFTMHDYYALAGIFVSTNTYYGTSVAPGNQRGGDLLVLPRVDGQLIPNKSIPPKRLAKLKADLDALKKRGEELRAMTIKAAAEGKDATEVVSLAEVLGLIWRSGGIEGVLETVDDEGNALPLAMGVADRDTIHDAPLLERGEISKPGPEVPRGFPQVVDLRDPPTPSDTQSGRLELAHWLTHRDHLLTARVMVNRVWHHLMGAGIVRTVDNFGFKGERPSHPELLDHLAIRFVEDGWSVKKLIRRIVLSRTYRQASTFNRDAFVKDPDNRLLWRANGHRVDAEVIRDSMLFVSGLLDESRRPASLIAEIGDKEVGVFGYVKQAPPDLDGSNHRSVYLPILRDRLPDVLDLFDFADPSMVTGARETTNVPVQALYFMNSPAVRRAAEGLADRVMREAEAHDQRIDRAFQLCYSRSPDSHERALAQRFFKRFNDETPTSDTKAEREAYVAYCQALLSTTEFRYVD